MVFTKREKIILAAAIAVVALLVLDYYVLTPLLDERAAVRDERSRLTARLAKAQNIVKHRRLLGRKWNRMLAEGTKRDPGEAESQLLRSLRDWADDAGVSISSLRPERSTEKSQLPEVTIHAAGMGRMSSVSRLLWRIETADIPAKVKMVQLGSRKDGTDDLSLHLKISTLYSPSKAASPKQVAHEARGAGGDR